MKKTIKKSAPAVKPVKKSATPAKAAPAAPYYNEHGEYVYPVHESLKK
jgi:hypothetical protein